MRLIVQPDAGFTPLVTALKQARKSVDVMIFRLDRPEIEEALAGAVAGFVVQLYRELAQHGWRGVFIERKGWMDRLKAGLRKTGNPQRVDRAFSATRQHHVGIAVLDHPGGITNRVCTR